MSWDARQSDSAGDPIGDDSGGGMRLSTALGGGLLPLFSAGGVEVQVHVSLIVLVALLLVLGPGVGLGWQDRVESVIVLLGICACRDAARCALTSRNRRGAIDLIISPFGGPASPRVGDRPLPMFRAIGFSLLINALLCVAAAGVVRAVDHSQPLASWSLAQPEAFSGWRTLTYHARWFFCVGAVLLGLGLLPIFPLPIGRVTHAFVVNRIGFAQGTLLTSASGIVGSVALLLVGASLHNWIIVAVAVCCGAECVSLRLLLHRALDALGDISNLERVSELRRRRRLSRRKILQLRRRAQRDAMELGHVDAVLEKVSRLGVAGISWRERRVLRRATRRHRDLEDFEDAPVME